MAKLEIRESGVWNPTFTPKNRAAAAWNNIKMIKARVGSNWVVVWPPGASIAGGSTPVVSMASVSNPLNIFAFAFGGGDADAEVIFTLGGDVQSRKNLGGSLDVGDWISDKTGLNGALYEIQAVVNSGAVSAGSDVTGSYIGLGVNRSWNVHQGGGGNGVEAANLDITVRKILDTGDSSTITVDLNATTEL